MDAQIDILLATFNGARYLADQIESIFAQDYPNWRVLARDDGSTDGTVEILRSYERRFPQRFQVLLSEGPLAGAKENFLALMESSTSPYVCFCDQDDVWMSHKLSLSLESMHRLEATWGKDLPLLVFSDLRLVDERLALLHDSFWRHEKIHPHRIRRFAAILVQNVVTGCTAMLNRPLAALAIRMPSEARMHDHWIALLASAFGKAMPLNAQTVLYRQHSQNVLGARKDAPSGRALVHRFRNSDLRRSQWTASQRQAESFLKTYERELAPREAELIRLFLQSGSARSRVQRTYLVLRCGFLRSGWLQNAALLFDQWTTGGGED